MGSTRHLALRRHTDSLFRLNFRTHSPALRDDSRSSSPCGISNLRKRTPEEGKEGVESDGNSTILIHANVEIIPTTTRGNPEAAIFSFLPRPFSASPFFLFLSLFFFVLFFCFFCSQIAGFCRHRDDSFPCQRTLANVWIFEISFSVNV